MAIQSVKCPHNVATVCPHYQLALKKRATESTERLVSIVIALVGILISGLAESDETSWFITLMMYIVSSLGSSLFRSKGNFINTLCYYVINTYSVICLLVCVLGISNVVVVVKEQMHFAKSGMFNGQHIMSAKAFYFYLMAIIGFDVFSWMVCGLYETARKGDASSKQDTRLPLQGGRAG